MGQCLFPMSEIKKKEKIFPLWLIFWLQFKPKSVQVSPISPGMPYTRSCEKKQGLSILVWAILVSLKIEVHRRHKLCVFSQGQKVSGKRNQTIILTR